MMTHILCTKHYIPCKIHNLICDFFFHGAELEESFFANIAQGTISGRSNKAKQSTLLANWYTADSIWDKANK